MSEKRSQGHGNDQIPLDLPSPVPGVGARQAPSPSPQGGGGYQDVCTVLEFGKKTPAGEKNAPARDPRLDDLQRMGLPRTWLDVAEAIGVDAFLTAWKILDDSPSNWNRWGSGLEISLRRYRVFLRYQRNRLIEAMSANGLTPPEIKRRLERQLRERLSIRHINRVRAADKLG